MSGAPCRRQRVEKREEEREEEGDREEPCHVCPLATKKKKMFGLSGIELAAISTMDCRTELLGEHCVDRKIYSRAKPVKPLPVPRLGCWGQWHMYRHLITIKIRIKSGTNKWM